MKTAMYFRSVTARFLSVALLALALANSAWALDLGEAKDRGLVGEAVTGYLAPVASPPSADVKALIADVNAKRRAKFEDTASRTDATLAQVQLRFYQLAVQNTKPGHYYQDSNGQWVKK